MHRVFEVLIGEWIQANPALDRPWIASADDLLRTLQRAEEVLDAEAADLMARHRLGHPHMWRARRAQIVTALRHGLQAELDDGATPLATEFGFGLRNDAPPVVWTSAVHPDVDVHFTGSIDRLDRMPDGSLRVMDLKTGSDTAYRSIAADHPFGAGDDKLQLAFYGWATAQARGQHVAHAAYRFVGRHDTAPDVLLQLDEGVQQALHERLDQIVTHIRDGEFLPGEVGTWGCDVCSPDALGADETNQRLGQWFAHAGIDAAAPLDDTTDTTGEP